MVYGSMRELARREPTCALHVHVGVRDPEDAIRAGQPPARPPADDARAVGQLAVLAGPRHRPGVGAHAALPGLPARRHPARASTDYDDYVDDRRPADPLRGVPRADLPVVGRAPAAAPRARSRCGSWTRRPRSTRPPRSSPSCSRSCASSSRRASSPPELLQIARGARREPLPRRARRHGGRAHRPRRRAPRARAHAARAAARRPSRRTPTSSAATSSCRPSGSCRETPASAAQLAVARGPKRLRGLVERLAEVFCDLGPPAYARLRAREQLGRAVSSPAGAPQPTLQKAVCSNFGQSCAECGSFASGLTNRGDKRHNRARGGGRIPECGPRCATSTARA